MQRIGFIIAGIAWFALVFLATFRLTFPSDAVADQVRLQVQEASRGEYAVEMSGVSPWWVGAKATDVRVMARNPRTPGTADLVFAADAAWVRVGLLSALRRLPNVFGTLRIGSGEVDFEAATTMSRRGDSLALSDLTISAPAFPLSELGSLIPDAEGTGTVDLEIALEAPEGLRTADGSINLSGTNLVITRLDLSSAGVPDLGMEIPLDDLDLAIDVREGKGEVKRGRIRSPMATLEIEGTLNLRDDPTRSSIDLTLLIGDIGGALEPFKAFIGTPWSSDNKIHYRCAGSINRPRCSADRERGGRSTSSSRPSSGPANTTTAGRSPVAQGAVPGSDEERERRKEEIRERLRQRREERAADNREPPPRDEDFEDEPLFEDEPVDDDFFLEDDGDGDDLDDLFEDAIPFEEAFAD